MTGLLYTALLQKYDERLSTTQEKSTRIWTRSNLKDNDEAGSQDILMLETLGAHNVFKVLFKTSARNPPLLRAYSQVRSHIIIIIEKVTHWQAQF